MSPVIIIFKQSTVIITLMCTVVIEIRPGEYAKLLGMALRLNNGKLKLQKFPNPLCLP